MINAQEVLANPKKLVKIRGEANLAHHELHC